MKDLIEEIKQIHKNACYEYISEEKWQKIGIKQKEHILETKIDLGIQPLEIKNIIGLLAMYLKELNDLLEEKNQILAKETKTDSDNVRLEELHNKIHGLLNKVEHYCLNAKNKNLIEHNATLEEINKCNEIVAEMNLIEALGKEEEYKNISTPIIKDADMLIAKTYTFYYETEWRRMSATEKEYFLNINHNGFAFSDSPAFMSIVSYIEKMLNKAYNEKDEENIHTINFYIKALTDIKTSVEKDLNLDLYKNLSDSHRKTIEEYLEKINETLTKYTELKESEINFNTDSSSSKQQSESQPKKKQHPFTTEQILSTIRTYEKKGEKIFLKGTNEEVIEEKTLIEIKSIFFLYNEAKEIFEKLYNKEFEELNERAIDIFLADFTKEKGSLYSLNRLLNKIFESKESHEFFIDFSPDGGFYEAEAKIYPEAALIFGKKREDFFAYLSLLTNYLGYDPFKFHTEFSKEEKKLKISVQYNKDNVKTEAENAEEKKTVPFDKLIMDTLFYATNYTWQNGRLYNKNSGEEIIDEELKTVVNAAKLIYNESKKVEDEYKKNKISAPSMEVLIESQINRIDGFVEQILNGNGNFQSEIPVGENEIDYTNAGTKMKSIKDALKVRKCDEILLFPPIKSYFTSYFLLKAKEKGIEIDKETFKTQLAIDKKNNTLIFNVSYEKKRDLEKMDSEIALEVLEEYINNLSGTDISEEVWKKSDLKFKRQFMIAKHQMAKKKMDKEQFEITKAQIKTIDLFSFVSELYKMVRLQDKSYAENNEAGINYANQEIDRMYMNLEQILATTNSTINQLPDQEREAYLTIVENIQEIFENQYSNEPVEEQEKTNEDNLEIENKRIEDCYQSMDYISYNIQNGSLTIKDVREFKAKLQIFEKIANQINDLEGVAILKDMQKEIDRIMKACATFYYQLEDKKTTMPVANDLTFVIFDLLNKKGSKNCKPKIGVNEETEINKLEESLSILEDLTSNFTFEFGNRYGM